ncbi:extracellular solute-binding protein [Salinibacterium sp. ZJ450]|uniref:extracellular solute-binding protein n=1 Tax=Salinibacterium sp. ZJ450 TaxID=2708338 RepID=UPI00174C1CDA|nr:extracellular solute-binding protein [Salinibacterium sp. ZJ450]
MLLVTACSAAGDTSNADGGDLSSQRLVFVNYGGAALEAAKTGWIEPFSDDTGVQIATDSPTDPAKIKTMVDGGRTTWDVVEIDAAVGGSQCGTLFEKRPPEFDMSEVNPDYVTDDCIVPVSVMAVGVVYNKELYGDNPPTKVEDFMNTEEFPGKRIFYSYPGGTVEPLLVTDGVAAEDVIPIDWSRVESIFDQLGDDAVPQADHVQQQASLESGDFGMCLCYLGRAAKAAENGANIGVLWDKIHLAWDGVYATKGSKAPEAQWAFLQHLATSKGQNPFYEVLPYGPTTLGEPPAVNPVYKEFLPTLHEEEIQQTFLYPIEYWTDHADEAFEEWTRITTG